MGYTKKAGKRGGRRAGSRRGGRRGGQMYGYGNQGGILAVYLEIINCR